jgi:hypothetical protein
MDSAGKCKKCGGDVYLNSTEPECITPYKCSVCGLCFAKVSHIIENVCIM